MKSESILNVLDVWHENLSTVAQVNSQ